MMYTGGARRAHSGTPDKPVCNWAGGNKTAVSPSVTALLDALEVPVAPGQRP
jgi:hypothetical protein